MKNLSCIKVSVVRDGNVELGPDVSQLDTPLRVAAAVRALIGPGEEREHFIAFFVDMRHKIKSVSVISIGTLSCSLVHPREVFRPAIVAGAAAVILAHNHPSGDCTPSSEDRESTRRLVKAGELLGIPVLDHVIVGEAYKYISFRETGLI